MPLSAGVTVLTAEHIVRLIKDKISKTKTFTGSFIYAYNNKTYGGLIKYKSPNKFLMNFYGKSASGNVIETGQKFISDGKKLWLVFKDQNIAIVESIETDKKTPLIGWNIERLLKEYVATLPKTGHVVKYQNANCFKLTFIPRSHTAGFKFINMIVGQEGEILKVEAQNQLGVPIELGIKYENTSINQPMSDENFEFQPDENTQIYENLLLPRKDELEESDND